jgi:hypothetical protein
MYKIKYKIAEWLVRFELLFNEKYSYQYYENLYVLENIQKEKYIETISKQMKRNWSDFYN